MNSGVNSGVDSGWIWGGFCEGIFAKKNTTLQHPPKIHPEFAPKFTSKFTAEIYPEIHPQLAKIQPIFTLQEPPVVTQHLSMENGASSTCAKIQRNASAKNRVVCGVSRKYSNTLRKFHEFSRKFHELSRKSVQNLRDNWQQVRNILESS